MRRKERGRRNVAIYHIDHVSLYVSDLDRSLSWYEQVLGLERAYVGSLGDGLYGAFLVVGDTMINVLQNSQPERDLAEQHLAFSVFDIDGMVRKLRALDVVFDFPEPVVLEEGYIAGQRYINFRDPDGVRLELVERSPAFITSRRGPLP